MPPEREAEPLTLARLNRILESPLLKEVPNDLYAAPERSEEPTDFSLEQATDEDLGYQAPFLTRLAKNRFARGLMSFLGLAGATKGLATGSESFKEYDRQQEVQQEIVSLAYDSSLDLTDVPLHEQLDLQEKVQITDSEMTRGELLNVLSENFTEQTTGLNGLARNIADTQLGNGQKGIDIFRFQVAYGDQVPLTGDALELLGEVVGFTPQEFAAYSKIIRTSVLERADLGNGMFYHDADQLNLNQAPEQSKALHRQRLEQSLSLTREIVKSLDFTTTSDAEQKEVVRVVSEAIRETIEADNAWTQAAGYTKDWSNTGLQKTFSDTFAGELLSASDEAELAWKKVSALDQDPEGNIHLLAEAMSQQLQEKGEAFFTKASQLDPTAKIFTEGQQHFAD